MGVRRAKPDYQLSWFHGEVAGIMDEPNCARLFPESIIPGFAIKHNAAVRQADHFELVRHHGSYRCAGCKARSPDFPPMY